MPRVLPRVSRSGPDDRWYSDVEGAISYFEITINPSSIPANSTQEETITLPDISSKDIVFVNKLSHTSGIGIVNSRVSSTGDVIITFINITGSAVDLPEETYRIVVIHV